MNKELLEAELAPFLQQTTKEELKTIAVENILGLTGTDEGRKFIIDSDKLLEGLISLTEDGRKDIKENVFKSLINLAVDEQSALKILRLKNHENKCIKWLKLVLDPHCKLADLVCKLLSNLTRCEKGTTYVANKVLQSTEVTMDRLVLVLCNLVYNEHAELHYLGAILSNLSQEREIRRFIMDKDQCIIQKLLPFTDFRHSTIRRAGVIGTLKNCCFDTDYLDWLLSDEVDLLPRLLLPLAGPEEFDDDDMDWLPDDLQYLPPDKEREPDPEIRKMLCEAILQSLGLTTEYLSHTGTYSFIRQLLCLPLLPAEHIQPTFQAMRAFNTADHIEPLLDYIERTWMRSTLWPVPCWSVYGRLIRTNNDVEGWHRRLNGKTGTAPPFYILVKTLFNESREVDDEIQLVSENATRKLKRKNYAQIQTKLLAAWRDYRDGLLTATGLLKRCSTFYKPAVIEEQHEEDPTE